MTADFLLLFLFLTNPTHPPERTLFSRHKNFPKFRQCIKWNSKLLFILATDRFLLVLVSVITTDYKMSALGREAFLYKLGWNFLAAWATTCMTRVLCTIFYFYKQCQLMKCFYWHRQWFKMAHVPCLYGGLSVCLSVCLHFKGMYVSATATGPGFLGVQTRSTTCAMTTNQPPAAPDCICYIPRKTEQNPVTPFVLVTRSMKTL